MPFTLLNDLCESRLFSSRTALIRESSHQIGAITYAMLLGLRVLLTDAHDRDRASRFCRRALADHGRFKHWRADANDLYVLLYALVDEGAPLADDGEPGRLLINPTRIVQWLKAAVGGEPTESKTARLLTSLDLMLRVRDSGLRALRRQVQDWPALSDHERRRTLARLIEALRHRAPKAEVLGMLLHMAGRRGVSVDDADLGEAASCGATGAANVATAVGGLGAGFDPDAHWRGVYPTPKKRKPIVLRRAPSPEED